MNGVMKFIGRKHSGKMILGLFILTNLVYSYMLLVTIPQTMEYSGGLKLLDMLPAGYDWRYVNELFRALGDKGRHTYLMRQLPVDMFYPLLFALSYSLVLAYLLNKLGKLNAPIIHLCWLPVIAGGADYLENFGIIKLLSDFPELSTTSVTVTSLFSILKSSSTSVFFIVLIITLIILGVRGLKRT
jgi:hypothetical protein